MDVFPITFNSKLTVKGFATKNSKMIWVDQAGCILNPISVIRDMHIVDVEHCAYMLQIDKDRYKIYNILKKDKSGIELDLLLDSHKSIMPDPETCGYCYEAVLMHFW